MRTLLLIATLTFVSGYVNAQTNDGADPDREFSDNAFQTQMAERMEKLFARERRRDSWAVLAKQDISEQLMSLGSLQIEQFDVDCKATICRIEVGPFSDDQLLAFASEVEAVFGIISFSHPLGLTRRNSMIRFYSVWTPMATRQLIAS